MSNLNLNIIRINKNIDKLLIFGLFETNFFRNPENWLMALKYKNNLFLPWSKYFE